MVVENKILKKVKELGLNSYEAKIWTALLSRGVSTAGEISDIANVPRSRSYDVLESLEKKGFIIMKVGKPIQYISVPPEEALERIKKSIQIQANEQVDFLKEFEKSEMLKELQLLHTNGIDSVDPTELTGFVKGRDNILGHISMVIKNAKENVKICTNEKELRDIEENMTRALNQAERNNVNIQVFSPNINKELNKRSNIQIKKTKLPGRYLIVDSSKVLFFITHESTHHSYETAVWVESESLAEVFEHKFNHFWNSSNIQVEAKLKAEFTTNN